MSSHPKAPCDTPPAPWQSASKGGTVTRIKVTPEEANAAELDTPWHVIVFNDPVNLMSYVTMVIQRIFGYPRTKAELMMLDVHHKGSCIVWTGQKEKAEHYVQQVQSYQLLCSMRKAAD